jgi:hypothetical protein
MCVSPQYHHARELDHVRYSRVSQVRLSELLTSPECQAGCPDNDDWHDAKLWWEPCYDWLSERVGFYPLFLGVGDNLAARHMTGYGSNWRRWARRSTAGVEWVRPGGFANQVLFSWQNAPDPAIRFTDYDYWHMVLNSVERDGHQAWIRPLSAWEERLALKRSWSRARWERKAHNDPYSVQAVVPGLDLRSADWIGCRNQATRRELIARGFDATKIEITRIPVDFSV